MNARERVRRLEYGLPSIEHIRDNAWEQQESWIVRQFDAFLSAVTEQQTGPPAWELLEPPCVPEFVLCCYLRLVVGQSPDPDWERRFHEEVSYWTNQRHIRSKAQWPAGSDNSEQLRSFLTEVGTLVACENCDE